MNTDAASARQEWIARQLAKAPAPSPEQLRAIREVAASYRQRISSES